MYIYIVAEHLERNYSGPPLIQLVELDDYLFSIFELVCANTKLNLEVAFESECNQVKSTKTESYEFSVKKIKWTIINDITDANFLKKFFGNNFYTFDFIKAIFNKKSRNLHEYECIKNTDFLNNFEQIRTIPKNADNLFVCYSGELDNTMIFSYTFDKKCVADFKRGLDNKMSYPRSLDNTLWLPLIELQHFKLYKLKSEDASKMNTILEKYNIVLENHNVAEYEYEEVFGGYLNDNNDNNSDTNYD